MKKVVLIITLLVLFSCKRESKKELFFLGKNAYEYPVWQDMLLQEKVKFTDVVLAFKAYGSTHDLDNETIEHFEKLEKRLKPTLDSEGYFTSDLGYYKELIAYRKALPNTIKASTNYEKAAAFFTSSIPNSNGYGNWKNLGPFGDPEVRWAATGNGAIEYLEMHPTNPAIMYACARNGGMWKTVDYGKNWEPQTDYFATNNTSCIEVSKENPSILYLGAAQDQKIWYSNDDGVSWQDRSSGLSGTIYDIHSDPSDASRVLAATTNGIYLSTDSGITWNLKLSGRYTDIDLTDNWDLIVVSDDNDNIAPVLNFSKDKGDTFIEKNIITHLNEVDRFYLAIYKPPTGATKVFAYGLKLSNTPTRFIGLWKSDYDPNPADNTSFFNFTEVKHPTYNYPNGAVPLVKSNTAPGYAEETSDYYGSINPYQTATWISDFYVSPNNENRMLLFREKFWGSEDGGVLWEYKPSYGDSNWADNRYVTTNVAKDSVFWCNDGGIWAIKESDLFPTDAEVTASGLSKNAYLNSKVVSKNGGLCVSEGSQMDVSQMNKGVFMTGGQDIGQVFTRNGRDSHVASADVYRGRIQPNDDTKFITGSLLVKLDGGTDIFAVHNNIEADNFNSNRLYGFTLDDVRLVRSPLNKDGWLVNGFKGENQANSSGHSWTPVHDNWETVKVTSAGITTLHPGTFEQSKANKELAFLGDEVGNRLFYTENLSAAEPTWIELPNAPKVSRYRIATHPYNENLIVIATNSGVYISKDKGETWKLKGNFPSTNPNAVLIDKNTTEGIYVYTTLTVYYSDENLTNWIEFNKGLPLQNNTDMRIAYYPNNDNRLYISKYGRGVWSSSLQSVLDKNGNKPVADFSIYGNDPNEIIEGESITLVDLSSNATELQWIIENGSDVINVGNVASPKVTLSTIGYYKVTLKASNTNGSDTIVKEQYIYVKANPITPNCVLISTWDLPWFKGISTIKLNEEEYNVTDKSNYVSANKVFRFFSGEESSIFIKDSYAGSFNLYLKAWIDYNNDGDFDDTNEEIISSGGLVDEYTSNFTVPNSAVKNKYLLMRVIGIESSTAPTSCQTTGTAQTVDLLVEVKSKVNFNNIQHSLVNSNSVTLEATFDGTTNVINSGFVYSKFNGDLNINNSSVSIHSSIVSNNTIFQNTISDLDYNGKYYYRPFVRDENGIYYGDIQNFELVPYKIPLAESLVALNLGNNQWKLKGVVFPENNNLEGLFIEYGISNFDNSISLNPSSYSGNSKFNIETEINTVLGNSYKFRIKYIANGKTYYSNIIEFNTDKTICTPFIDNSPWFKVIGNVTFDGNSNNSSGSEGYQDFTNIIFEVKEGESYPISITDSYAPGFNLSYAVYIDYNNDGDFTGYNEVVASQSVASGETFTGTITIPTEDVVYDTTLRMRVIGYEGNLNSCQISTGQIEDYLIKIESVQNTITAVTETFTGINGKVGRVTASVLSNDMLNGVLLNASEVTLTAGTSPAPQNGSIVMNSDGTITVSSETTAGTYDYEYTICEKLNSSNCSTIISKVVVDSSIIEAKRETFTGINGKVGGVTASVLLNDTLNGTLLNASEVTLTAGTSPTPQSGNIIMNSDGTITVSLGTSAGTYDYEYTICEKLNPSNCSTIISKVVVDSSVIEAKTETFTGINGKVGGVTTSILLNDTLNGILLNISEVTLTVGTSPTPQSGNIVMNSDGTITVSSGTTAGTYDYEYTICEKLNLSNCSTIISKVVVDSSIIEAKTETFTGINGKVGGVTTSILLNDTLNGILLNISEVTLTTVASPTPQSGSIVMNSDGTITVSSETTAGTYDYEYTICEKLNPSNCSIVTSKVVVDSSVIEAKTETFTGINGKVGGVTASVLSNDMLNGTLLNASEVTLTAGTSPTPQSGNIAMNSDGTITVSPETTAGTYDYEYTICEKLNPSNCSTVTSKVVVDSSVIEAKTETFTGINGKVGGVTASVFSNDILNGSLISNISYINFTAGTSPNPLNGSIVMNSDGIIIVSSETTAGTYDYEYTICEKLNPSNCSTVTSKVVVDSSVIEAKTETFTGINGKVGGVTASVLSNDMLNGALLNSSEVTLTAGTSPVPQSGSIVMNSDGTITVSSGTTAGTYDYEYTICEKLNPSNCSTVISKVIVDSSIIEAKEEIFTNINGRKGEVTASVLSNDLLNGLLLNVSDIDLTVGASPNPLNGSIVMNSDGTITVSPETTGGTYDYEYTICEKLNPSNCSTIISKIMIENDVVDANSITIYPVPVTNTLFISTYGLIGDPFDIHVFDVNGQSIYRKREYYKGEDFKVDTSKLSVGMYIINVYGTKFKKETKFMKM
ncbi:MULTISPECIES: GEVED domain-containing protein [unclassified Tenacibaculum]|uniref:GEVED domain-containing protein n=1 Tax=unclassified Tenacibaculum TaxID=2635139 RepID=UPI001F2600FA|nr:MULTISPECIES: GEVED domain-containing protein [unclassified Tenacibaculum]MCF2875284.1 GEVED domain-containing protein [Tenacibaculum sp. Cn5-1]MCF2935360.1 GEVED domain-containing protein [Tenacibaculum sp. Cn5-34]MCG7511920.1 GEVED domain-containing protein [Tenacibaculum sp. Cn5-46]